MENKALKPFIIYHSLGQYNLQFMAPASSSHCRYCVGSSHTDIVLLFEDSYQNFSRVKEEVQIRNDNVHLKRTKDCRSPMTIFLSQGYNI